jgi:hypothetical protein
MNTAALTKKALADKKARGEWCGGVPYGFGLHPDGIHLVENQTEQNAIAVAKELRAAGLTLRRIGDELLKRGICPRRSALWQCSTVRNILDENPSRVWHPNTIRTLLASPGA